MDTCWGLGLCTGSATSCGIELGVSGGGLLGGELLGGELSGCWLLSGGGIGEVMAGYGELFQWAGLHGGDVDVNLASDGA